MTHDPGPVAHLHRLRGHRLRLPQSRRLVTDLLNFSRKVPTHPLVRHMRILRLAELQRRRDGGPRVSWPALFLKAYGLLSERRPELRQCFMSWLWPHLYQHPVPIGRLTVSRSYAGQDWVFFAHVPEPNRLGLLDLQREILRFKHAPVESVERFRLQLRFSRLPTPVRRLAWWWTLNISGARRANRFGTFGLTTVSAQGAISVHPPSIPATTLTYGPVDCAGQVRVTIVYDHRLMDGAFVAGCLQELEALLETELADELLAIRESFLPGEERARVSTAADRADSRIAAEYTTRIL